MIVILINILLVLGSLMFIGMVASKIDEIKANRVEKPPENESYDDKEKRINTIERRVRVVKGKEYICRRFKDTYPSNTEYYCPLFGGTFVNGKVKHFTKQVVKEGLYVICGYPGEHISSLTLSGIQTGDIITKVNGKKIVSAEDIFNLYPEIGDSFEFEFKRQDKTYKTTVCVFDEEEAMELVYLIGRGTFHEINQYRNSDYFIGLDTNILLKYLNVVTTLSHAFSFIISKQVFDELDKQKTNDDIGHLSRQALKLIEEIQLNGGTIVTAHVDIPFLNKHKLNPKSPDEKIIGSYLQEQMKGKKILFISEDRGARVTARQFGLQVIDFGKQDNELIPTIEEVSTTN